MHARTHRIDELDGMRCYDVDRAPRFFISRIGVHNPPFHSFAPRELEDRERALKSRRQGQNSRRATRRFQEPGQQLG